MTSTLDNVNSLHVDETAFKVRVTQEATRIKTKCKKLFFDLDQSKYQERLSIIRFSKYRQRWDHGLEGIYSALGTQWSQNVG